MAIIFLNSQIKASDPRAVEFIEQLVKSGAAYTGEIPNGFITCIDKKICCSEIPWEERDIIASNEYGNFYTVKSQTPPVFGTPEFKNCSGATLKTPASLSDIKKSISTLEYVYSQIAHCESFGGEHLVSMADTNELLEIAKRMASKV